jgi:hypothetical protein
MMTSIFRQLTVLLLLMTVLSTPLASLAHDLKSGAITAVCAGQMRQDDGTGPPVACPGAGQGDYCEHEECFEDAQEPPCASGLTLYPAPMQVFHPNPARALLKVYLAIFVPPESCCCSSSP